MNTSAGDPKLGNDTSLVNVEYSRIDNINHHHPQKQNQGKYAMAFVIKGLMVQ